MSDRDVLIEMLDRRGIAWDEEPETERGGGFASSITVHVDRQRKWPELGRAGPMTLGYGGFFTEFAFDASGALLAVGAWE